MIEVEQAAGLGVGHGEPAGETGVGEPGRPATGLGRGSAAPSST